LAQLHVIKVLGILLGDKLNAERFSDMTHRHFDELAKVFFRYTAHFGDISFQGCSANKRGVGTHPKS